MTGPARRLRVAAAVIAVADAAVLCYGLLALLFPHQLVAGYEHYTNRPWAQLTETSPDVASFILATFRLVGALNVAAAIPAIAIALTAFRARQRWAWWTLLAANSVAFAAPMLYDQVTGAIGPFEALEYVALAAVYTALGATYGLTSRRAASGDRVREFGDPDHDAAFTRSAGVRDSILTEPTDSVSRN